MLRKAKEIIKEDHSTNINNISEDDNDSDEQEFVYSNFGSLNSINPFLLSVRINLGSHIGLINTGSDTSLIHEENVSNDLLRSNRISTIRSVSGKMRNIIGIIWNIEVKNGTKKFKLNPYIVRGNPKYTIISYKDILKAPQLILNLLNCGSFSSQKTIRMISFGRGKNNTLEKFKDLFTEEIQPF